MIQGAGMGLGAIWALGLFLLGGEAELTSTGSAGPAAIEALPWHFKVRPGALPRGGPSLQLGVARGECEGGQVLIRPPARGVEVDAVRLQGPGGALVPRLYREHFIRLERPSNVEGAAGAWPDPLIPLVDAYRGSPRRALPADSTAAAPLVLYVEVCVPGGQEPGFYTGKLRVRAKGGAPRSLPVSVEVLPITLPATSSLPNSFGISLYSIARGHRLDPESPQARRLLADYAKALLAHRISAHGLSMTPPRLEVRGGTLKVDFERYDAELGPFLEGSALPSGARFTTAELREPRGVDDALKIAYYQKVKEHFAERGWGARLFFYAKDEPTEADFPEVLRQSARVRRAGGIPVLVTSPLEPALLGATDILCPTLNCFFEREGPQTCRAVLPSDRLRARLGRRPVSVWWYQSCNSHGCNPGPSGDPAIDAAYSGWASYMVDHAATRNRAMGALAFLAGVEGELYFDTVYAYNPQDPWESVYAFGGNGDGTLFYPGVPARIGGRGHAPVESLRLKHLRDGLEDYEYLRLYSARHGERAARGLALRLVRSGYEITEDGAKWEAVRRELIRGLRGSVK